MELLEADAFGHDAQDSITEVAVELGAVAAGAELAEPGVVLECTD